MDEETLNKIETEYQAQKDASDNYYNTVLANNEKLYNQQQDYTNNWETTQNEILDKQLANQTDLINQQKEEAQKTNRQETNAALNDYSAYVNPYGYQAERIADNGLSKSGANTSSQLGAYTTYQNRVAAANTALQSAITSYDNDINAAKLQNDVTKAENALSKLQMQLEYAQTYYSNYATYAGNQLSNNQDLYNNYVTQQEWEKTFAENQRQYNADLAEKQREYNASLAEEQRQYNTSLTYNNTVNGSGTDEDGTEETNNSEESTTSNVNPYTKTVNRDVANGTFSNGYQPDNVNGIKVEKTGSTTTVNGEVSDIYHWEYNDTDYLLIWDYKQNAYVPYDGTLSTPYKSSSLSNTNSTSTSSTKKSNTSNTTATYGNKITTTYNK